MALKVWRLRVTLDKFVGEPVFHLSRIKVPSERRSRLGILARNTAVTLAWV